MSTTASADTGTLAAGAPPVAPCVAAVAGDSTARANASAKSPAPSTLREAIRGAIVAAGPPTPARNGKARRAARVRDTVADGAHAMPVSSADRRIRPRTSGRSLIRGALALVGTALLLVAPRAGGAEAPEPPPDPRVPMVTLDALPLGVPLTRLGDEAR